jgi:hypothetical protein
VGFQSFVPTDSTARFWYVYRDSAVADSSIPNATGRDHLSCGFVIGAGRGVRLVPLAGYPADATLLGYLVADQ